MSDIFKRYDFSLKQAVVDKDSDYSMLHHHYYACACVLFELCRVCRLGDCFLILRNPAYPIEYATTTWWQSILERGMNAI